MRLNTLLDSRQVERSMMVNQDSFCSCLLTINFKLGCG
ncbi:MAG: hypothetical protein OFPII_06220 [Osedax symbiont Rs1]|nr:MAG: hypothetical protein OFPII_06220 [Osedax symbiont Rs1]